MKNSDLKFGNQEDLENYEVLDHCLEYMGFEQDEKLFIWSNLASILNLGNIKFEETYIPGKHDVVNVKSSTQIYLEKAANLIGISTENLHQILTTKPIFLRNELKDIQQLSLLETEKQRDSFAKHLYSSTFTWILQKINL